MDIVISTGNTKVGKIHNISLPPGISCNNAPCKDKCYAMKAWRMYDNVRKAWTTNWDAYKSDPMGYFRMVAEYCIAKKAEMFRWHVAGDIPDQAYYQGMCLVAKVCTETHFLAFTKNLRAICSKRPDNLRIVASSWPNITYDELEDEDACWFESVRDAAPIAWYIPKKYELDQGNYKKLVERESGLALECSGACDQCFLCWALEPGTGVKLEEH